jgi:hypothetical protein
MTMLVETRTAAGIASSSSWKEEKEVRSNEMKDQRYYYLRCCTKKYHNHHNDNDNDNINNNNNNNNTSLSSLTSSSSSSSATAKKTVKTKRASAYRHGSVTLVPWFKNVFLLLVVLSIMMFVVVESFSPLPDGNGKFQASGRTGDTLGRIVDDWVDTNKRPGIEAIYGPIGDWNVSLVTNFKYVFYNKQTFNTDISKWVTTAAVNMAGSECSPLQIIFFPCRCCSYFFDSFNVFFLCNSSTFLTIFLLIFSLFFFRLRSFFCVLLLHARKTRHCFLMLNFFYLSFTCTIG